MITLSQPTVLEYALTAKDYRRYQLFIASGKRRSTSAWTFIRVYRLVIYILALASFFLALARGVLNSDGVIASLFVVVLLMVQLTVGPGLAAARAAKRTAGWLDRRRVSIDAEGIRSDGEQAWSYVTWASFVKTDTIKGDIFLFTSSYTAFLIPGTAFASEADSQRLYETIQRYFQESRAEAATQTNQSDGAWPPAPKSAIVAKPLPQVGPTIDETQATVLVYELTADELNRMSTRVRIVAMLRPTLYVFVIVICLYAAFMHGFDARLFGRAIGYSLVLGFVILRRIMSFTAKASESWPASAFKQRLVTDFKTLRIESQTGATAYNIPALIAAKRTDGRVVLQNSPVLGITIPERAFESRQACGEFVKRMAAGIRAGR